MKLGADDRKKVILASVLGGIAVICGFYLYNSISGPSTPAAPAAAPTVAAPVVTSSPAQVAVTRPVPGVVARKVAMTAGQLDPTLHMESMDVTESLAYTGTGRNIFSPNSAPLLVPLPKPIASARPGGAVAPLGPVGPVGPPPPPPIDLKFFGTETAANGSLQAFLLHGEDVYVAANGEIVGRRYKVISIGPNSVEVEDMPNNNRQMLPLEAR